ncbi:hypothetical protein SH1V18_15090 [Vallitalea longa]|uniref:Uncharacterized protein n=1 Tax=Vallitalea longa TaxID=2936439 RepID=A0A9W6DFS8_9FIRM|nr:hypothetical protein [Vallitalea longa]GKX29029.1 hypothetical protein SH1V18_15090 [Vallitalea longa]
MNKIGFLLSGLLTLIGFITLNLTSFTNKLLPKIGRMIFELSSSGSYTQSDYKIFFASTNSLALFEIIIGLGLCVFFYIKISKAD